jgi:hypothetical protein
MRLPLTYTHDVCKQGSSSFVSLSFGCPPAVSFLQLFGRELTVAQSELRLGIIEVQLGKVRVKEGRGTA